MTVEQLGRVAAEVAGEVGHVALQHGAGIAVARGIDRLRQVDDDRALGADQNVVFGEVAVDDPGAEHAHHLAEQPGMEFQGLLDGQFDVIEPRRRMAVCIGHQVHQQHALVAEVGLRDLDSGGGEAIQGIDLGALPGFFLHLAAVARALRHGPRLTAVLGLAAFLVGHALAKTALRGVLVHLGAADFLAAAHDIDGRLLAAH